jgi:ribosomal protein S18 acetylase RimI-like enzyme
MSDDQVTIRTARAEDVEAMVAVHSQARAAYYMAGGVPAEQVDDAEAVAARHTSWARAVESSDKRAFCAVSGAGRVVGVLGMGRPYGHPDLDPALVRQLYQIQVLPGVWRRGIGSLLIAAFQEELVRGGRRTGVLDAWEANERGRSFYRRHGWSQDGHRRPGPLGRDYLRLRWEADV